MANRNPRDWQDRDRRYNRQAEQFDSTEYGWFDEERGQMGEGSWRDEEYGYIQDELPTHPSGRYGPNPYAPRQGAGFASFTGSDQGGRDFTSPRYTGDRTSSGGYGFGFRPDHPRGDRNRRGWFERAGDEVASWFGSESATRRREEDHRGKGPSGYVRSDARIQEDANDRLTDDRRVDARNIQVSVNDGEITLDGTVTSRWQKHHAEHCVEDISGAKHVQNNLRVQQASETAL
ncbi:MAG: BON domain-containing protein [Altererythrobacter sp.]|nr:BON domain-containing protein [Altererythrobacter sp.]OJU60554.1 MAG: hypothetical protein BGO08_10175 [Altererythrobacter sp. 66-12]